MSENLLEFINPSKVMKKLKNQTRKSTKLVDPNIPMLLQTYLSLQVLSLITK